MVNKRGLFVKEELEKAGWKVFHSGSPDFLAVRQDKDGNIMDSMFVEVKPEVIDGKLYTDLSDSQRIYKKVLEQLGAFYSVRRVRINDAEFNKKADFDVLAACVVDMGKTIMREYENRNALVYVQPHDTMSYIMVNSVYFKALIEKEVSRIAIGNITEDSMYDYLLAESILLYKEEMSHPLPKVSPTATITGYAVNVAILQAFITKHTG